MSNMMNIYQQMHEARCEQIKGNTTAAMSHYSTAMNMIDEARSSAAPEELATYENLMKMVIEEFELVGHSMNMDSAGNGKIPQNPTLPKQSTTSQPASSSFIPSPEPYFVSPTNDSGLVTELLEEEPTHPPFAEQLEHDIAYVKNFVGKGINYCADTIQQIDSNPRVKAFQQGSVDAGIALVSGIATSAKLLFKAFSDLLTEPSREETNQPNVQSEIPQEQPPKPNAQEQSAYLVPELDSEHEEEK